MKHENCYGIDYIFDRVDSKVNIGIAECKKEGNLIRQMAYYTFCIHQEKLYYIW